MGTNDKVENTADKAKGKAKEAVGDATDNEQWQAEGKLVRVAWFSTGPGEFASRTACGTDGHRLRSIVCRSGRRSTFPDARSSRAPPAGSSLAHPACRLVTVGPLVQALR